MEKSPRAIPMLAILTGIFGYDVPSRTQMLYLPAGNIPVASVKPTSCLRDRYLSGTPRNSGDALMAMRKNKRTSAVKRCQNCESAVYVSQHSGRRFHNHGMTKPPKQIIVIASSCNFRRQKYAHLLFFRYYFPEQMDAAGASCET